MLLALSLHALAMGGLKVSCSTIMHHVILVEVLKQFVFLFTPTHEARLKDVGASSFVLFFRI